MVAVTDYLVIPDEELQFVASPSSGPGGQNVNKVSTRVTLLFDVRQSPSLSAYQRARISDKLANRINEEGVLRVICQVHRTQKANREEVVLRFVALLQSALRQQAVRHKTHVPASAHARRLDTKRRTGVRKQMRGPVRDPEE